jgi:hypothetical protein
MIGVAASPADLGVAQESLGSSRLLGKPAVPGRKYRIVLSTDSYPENLAGELSLTYVTGKHAAHREPGIDLENVTGPLPSSG